MTLKTLKVIKNNEIQYISIPVIVFALRKLLTANLQSL